MKQTEEALKYMLAAPFGTYVVAYTTRIKAALAEVNRYRLHDLQKNPEDLPEEDGMYFIYYTFDGDKSNTKVPYCEVYCCATGWNTPGGFKVVAWKQIEPYEEAKE